MTKPNRVPKIIHQIIGPKTSPLIDQCIESWKRLLKHGFKIQVWNDKTIESFLKELHPFAHRAFLDARNHAEAADIARYLIIYTYGGYYVDWDVELLDYRGFLLLTKNNPNGYMLIDPANNTLASEYFCSIPKDKYLLKVVEDIVEIYNKGNREAIFTPQYSGPYRMRDSLATHGKTKMNLVPVKEVFVYDYSEIRNPQHGPFMQPLIHYWVHSWL